MAAPFQVQRPQLPARGHEIQPAEIIARFASIKSNHRLDIDETHPLNRGKSIIDRFFFPPQK